MSRPLVCATLGALLAPAAVAAEPQFVERSEELGIDFTHRHFGTGEKRMPENMGSGVAVFDANGDGRLDLYFVQGRPWSPAPSGEGARNRLFLQRPSGRFSEAAKPSGAEDPEGYGMGVAFGDVDRDGDDDLVVTNYGANRLFLNRGDATFERSAARLPEDDGWSTGATLFDAEGDGDLDLWVANYLVFEPTESQWCGNAQTKLRSYCHPDLYDGQPDVFLRNGGDGTFAVATPTAGVKSSDQDKGLGVVALDFDGDGRQDVFVANDSTMNYLYRGREGGFDERGLLAGVAVNGKGATEASMGVAIADLNGDTRPELFVTHLDEETNTLYRGLPDGRFRDGTSAAGLATPSLPWVGFGTAFLDFDLDGDLDLFVANGHIIDNIEAFDAARSHRQPPQLFENLGDGRFVDRSEMLGVDERWVGRSAVAADLDGDGDEDLVVTQNDGPAKVLVNETADGSRALAVRLVGVESNLAGIGARVEVVTRSARQVRWMLGASGYLSQGPAELYFGVGSGQEAEVVVRWPSGAIDHYPKLESGFVYELREGGDVLTRRAFASAEADPSADLELSGHGDEVVGDPELGVHRTVAQ